MKRKNDIHEFKPLLVEIEDRPLNPLGRSILWIVVAILVFGIGWLFLARIDVVVSARGKIVPSGEIKILQPIETGVISKIFVKEGDSVSKGQVLMQIDPSVTETSLESKKKDAEVLKLEVARLDALVSNKSFDIQKGNKAYLEQFSLYQHQLRTIKESRQQFKMKKGQIKSQANSTNVDISRLENIINKDKEKLNRMEKVLDIIAKNDYDEVQKNVLSLTEQLNMSYHKKDEIQKKLNEVIQEEKVYEEQMMTQWYTELSQKRKELRTLESQINAIKFQNQKQQIKAPLDGYVGKLLVHTEGGVVTPAEKLISIIPKDAPLIIKATVLNKDIGFVKQEMKAAIKIDTFSFQKYGLIDGNVKTIGNHAIEDEKLGPVYEIKVTPSQTSLMVEGEKKRLEPGMSVTAEIKVGKRRIIEFFIYPLIKYLDEGLSVR